MEKEKTKERKYIITENANRFSYKGPLNDWDDMNKKKEVPKERNIDFSTFKKQKNC